MLLKSWESKWEFKGTNWGEFFRFPSPQGVVTMKKESHYGHFFEIEIKDGKVSFHENVSNINEVKKAFWKESDFL